MPQCPRVADSSCLLPAALPTVAGWVLPLGHSACEAPHAPCLPAPCPPARLPACLQAANCCQPLLPPTLPPLPRYHLDTGAANEHVPLNESGFFLPFYMVRAAAQLPLLSTPPLLQCWLQ